MKWFQRDIQLPAKARGFHLITNDVTRALPELADFRCGQLHLFLQHTSASLTINEAADGDVRRDFESFVSALVPESFPYRHDAEGPDDMPAHIKASLFGPSLVIPVGAGALRLGTWQGIYLCEHRDEGGPRRLVLTLSGE